MSELAHTILSTGKAGYLTRLGISLALVSASLMPAATYFGPDSRVFLLNWTWMSLLLLALPGLHFLLDIPPALFGVLTAAGLAFAALRFRASVLATVWFIMNALVATGIWAFSLQQTQWYGGK